MPIPYTWIYLIKDNDTGLYKIGKSDDPERRLAQLKYQSTILPKEHDFEIVEAWMAPESKERELHEMFNASRVRGEWFDLGEDGEIELTCHMWSYERFYCTQSEQVEWLAHQKEYAERRCVELENNSLALGLRLAKSFQIIEAKLRWRRSCYGLLPPADEPDF